MGIQSKDAPAKGMCWVGFQSSRPKSRGEYDSRPESWLRFINGKTLFSENSSSVKVTQLCFFAVLVFWLLPVTPIFSQLITTDISQYAHTSWLARDGYFPGTVLTATQTKDGYIWVGTSFGLLRFDGVSFIPSTPRGGESIAGRQINKILGARDGSIWIGVQDIGLVHIKEGRMTTISALEGVAIFTLLEDHAGDIWAGGIRRGSQNNLCRIHGEAPECFGDTKLFGGKISQVFEDKTGVLWVGAWNGFWRWAPGKPKQYVEKGINSLDKLVLNVQDVITESPTKNDPVTHGLHEAAPAQYRIAALGLKECLFLTDREGALWMAPTFHGLAHSIHGRVDSFRASDGLSGDNVRDLFQDREGDIWVVTINGLDRFRKTPIAIVSNRQGLGSGIPLSLLADGNTLWVATFDDLDLLANNAIRHLEKMNGQPTDDVRSLYLTAAGDVIIARGIRDGLASISSGRLTKIPTPSGYNTFVITEDGEHGLWVSNREAGLEYISKNGRVKVRPWSEFGSHPATAMAFDAQRKGLWLASDSGDLEFFQDNQVKIRYLNKGEVFKNPRNLLVTSDGAVWLASNAGLTVVREGSMATLSSRNGLPCDAVHWRVDDTQGFTWLRLSCGIARLAPGELDRWSRDPNTQVKVTTFLDTFDGTENELIGPYYTPTASIIPDGRLAFVTNRGLAVIDPRRDVVNHVPPPVHVDRVEADAERQSLQQYLSLLPNTHVVRIGYSALSFRIPQKVRFRYMLEGYDKHWSETAATREAVYTNLPPATYRFRVIACNDSGIWNNTGDTLSFTVRAAFYQTRWFLFLCLAVLAGMMWILYRTRVIYLSRQITNRVEAQASERLKVSRDLHDTLLQSIQGLILSVHAISEEPTLGTAVRQKIVALSGRAEEAMQEGRDKIRALRFEDRQSRGFVEEIARLASRINPEEAPRFDISATGKEVPLNPLVYEELCFICREALNNAFQHANAQKVEVLVSYGNSRFGLVVRDDGRGFQSEAIQLRSADGHWGVIGMRERASRIGAKFEIKRTSLDKVNPGTTVSIEIPAAVAYAKATVS
jgi:signal transduction histidine kinase/ligand-binding sensor domain-containing protein